MDHELSRLVLLFYRSERGSSTLDQGQHQRSDREFEIDSIGRAEIAVPLEGCSRPVHFSLRGLEVGPGRVMIDFAQGGRPTGSLDLTPRVAATIDPERPSGDAACPAEVLPV